MKNISSNDCLQNHSMLASLAQSSVGTKIQYKYLLLDFLVHMFVLDFLVHRQCYLLGAER